MGDDRQLTTRRWSDEAAGRRPNSAARPHRRRFSVQEDGTHLSTQVAGHQQASLLLLGLHPQPPTTDKQYKQREAISHQRRRASYHSLADCALVCDRTVNDKGIIAQNVRDNPREAMDDEEESPRGETGDRHHVTRPKSARFGQRPVAEDEESPSGRESNARPASRRSRPRSARHGRGLTVTSPVDGARTDGQTPRTRPKSAKYGYRIPQYTGSDLEDSACEQDIETLNLEDSDNDCRGSDGSDSSNSDAPIEAWDIGLHGDAFNNRKNTMHCPSNAPNKEDNISSKWDSAILDVGEDPDGDTLSDRSTESGHELGAVLRIKRKHLRRRVVSTSDIETDQRSRKCSLVISAEHNNAAILHSEIDSSFIAEKLVERYRRRAASDASRHSHADGVQLDGADTRRPNNSQTNKRAMPPMPRKLRPIFRRSENLLGESGGSKANGHDRGEGDSPAEGADNCPLVTVVPPSFRMKKPLDEFTDVIPTSPQNVQKNKSKRNLKPIQPLTVSLGEGGATYESDSPPDSACIMDKCSGGFALAHRRLSDSLSRSPITPRSPSQLSSRENSFVFDDQAHFRSNKTTLQPIKSDHKLFGSGEIPPDKEPAVKKPALRTRSLPMEPMRITSEKSMTDF